MTTRPTRFQDLESFVCSARSAVLLAEMAFDGIPFGNGDDANMVSYALGRARDEANRLHAAYFEAYEAERLAARVA